MVQKIKRARELATNAHEGQTRKYSGEPYIVHPEDVHDTLCIWLGRGCEIYTLTDDQICKMRSAAYHDVKEDCPQITDEQIVEATDADTLSLVCELTNPSKSSTAPRRIRKQMDRDHLATVSWEAKIIKLIDRTVNLKDMADCPDKGFLGLYASESRKLWEILKDADKILADQLLKRIEKAEELSNLKD